VLAAARGPLDAARAVADGAWALDQSGASALAFGHAAHGLALAAEGPHDATWARLILLDIRRREADPASLGIPLDPPERAEAARILDGDIRYRGDAPWAIVRTRDEALQVGIDQPYVLTFWAGAYREALPMWRHQAVTALEEGRLLAAVVGLAGTARCAAALGTLGEADDAIGRASTLAGEIGLVGPQALNLFSARDDLTYVRNDGWEELIGAASPFGGGHGEPTNRWALGPVNAAIARIAALAGDVTTTAALLDEVLHPIAAITSWSLGASRMIGDAVAAAWMIGGDTPAAVLTDLRRAVRYKVLGPDFRWVLVDGRLDAARLASLQGRSGEAEHLFARARASTEESGQRPLRALADLDEAIDAARLGDDSKARKLVDAALPVMSSIGMTGWIRRAERLGDEL
jgi:hypothetical protein